MPRLDDHSRTLTFCASALCFATAFAATPKLAQSATVPTVAERTLVEAKPSESRIKVVQPQRDPFVGDHIEAEGRSNTSAIEVPPPGVPGSLLPLPPNEGALATRTARSEPGLRLQAVVNGGRPVALVVDATGTHVVAIGDRIDGSTVAHISRDGLTLSDGRWISIELETRSQPQRSWTGPVPLVPTATPTPLSSPSVLPQEGS